MNQKKIRILLADDHNVLREGLRALLDKEDDMEVVADVSDGRSAVTEARRSSPDVVVMDIGMQGLNGIEATRQISSDLFRSRVLCLSVQKDHGAVREMLKAGASGYLVKSCAKRELVEAVRVVAEGKSYLSPMIAEELVEYHVRGKGEGASHAYTELTEREREVLQLVSEGRHTKDIADQLGISPKTVLAHREKMMTKLDIDSIAGLTRFALREGITEL